MEPFADSVDEFTIEDEFRMTTFDVMVFRHKKLGSGESAEVYEGHWKGTVVASRSSERVFLLR